MMAGSIIDKDKELIIYNFIGRRCGSIQQILKALYKMLGTVQVGPIPHVPKRGEM